MDLLSVSQSMQFYTAPSSPILPGTESGSDDTDFEFEVSTRTFASRCEFRQTYPAIWWTKRNDNEQINFQLPSRARSFCSGEVLPLKPPPRLNTSVSSSPRSPNSLLRIPFSRPCAWNDDFDPFQFALEKVSDETRARMGFHRRSQSYSAYRTSSVAHWLDGSMDRNKDHKKQGPNFNNSKTNIFDPGYGHLGLSMTPSEHLKPRGPTFAKMMERRESVYSRRVAPGEAIAKPRSKSSLMVRTKTKGLWLGRRVKEEDHEARCESSCTESKMQRVISFLFKLKKCSNENKRSMKLRRCLGYAPGSPPFMK